MTPLPVSPGCSMPPGAPHGRSSGTRRECSDGVAREAIPRFRRCVRTAWIRDVHGAPSDPYETVRSGRRVPRGSTTDCVLFFPRTRRYSEPTSRFSARGRDLVHVPGPEGGSVRGSSRATWVVASIMATTLGLLLALTGLAQAQNWEASTQLTLHRLPITGTLT